MIGAPSVMPPAILSPLSLTMEKYEIIQAAEIQCAREATIGVIYQEQPSARYYLIPGMFI